MATNGKTALTIRRTPFDALEEFRASFPSLFDVHWPFSLRAGRLPEESHPPSVDMFERDGKLVVKAEMPGIAADAIDVTVSDGELRISGERREEKEVREENYYRSERSYGRVYRALPLPQGCDVDNVTATAKDGIVEILIPKMAAAAGKKIDVKTA